MSDERVNFGRHLGQTLAEIAAEDPSYIVWLADNVKRVRVPKDLRDACEQEVRDDDSELYPFGDDVQ